MQAKEIKNGSVVNYNGSPVLIESVNVQTPSARGAATLYKFRGRNLVTKQKTDITLKGGESLEAADFGKRGVKLMYVDATDMHLLDQTDFNQYTVPLADIENEARYITEELEKSLGASKQHVMLFGDANVKVGKVTRVQKIIGDAFEDLDSTYIAVKEQ